MLLILPLLLFACAVEQPSPTPKEQQKAPAEPVRRCLLLVAYAPAVACRCDAAARREVKGAVSKALVDSGRYELLDAEVVAPYDGAPSDCLRVANRLGASRVALLRIHQLDLATRVHHVRHYQDGSAAGELLLIDGATSAIEKAARETVYLSTRARYASTDYARDLLLGRLAARLAAGLK